MPGSRINHQKVEMQQLMETPGKPQIAVVMDNMHSFQKYVSKIIAGAFSAAGFDCINIVLSKHDLDANPDGKQTCLNVLEYLSGGKVSGILALTSSVGAHLEAQEFYKFVDSIKQVPVVHMGSIADCEHSVGIDNRHGMRELLEHLTNDSNCQKLCLVRGFGQLSDSAEREKEFRKHHAVNRLPLDPDFIIDGQFRESVTYNAVTKLLQSGKVPDAILAANDHMAAAAARAVQTFGLSVPDDVCVSGFDDRSIATESLPQLTSVRVNLEEYSTNCANALLDLMKPDSNAHPADKNSGQQTSSQVCRLIPRQSTVKRDDFDYQAALKEISKILEGEELKRNNVCDGEYYRSFMDTLKLNSSGFEAVIDEFDAFYDIEFDQHNVLRELFAAIGELLEFACRSEEADPGVLRMSILNHKISRLLYDAKAKQMLIGERNQQNYHSLQMELHQCRNIDSLIKVIDSAFDMFSLVSGYLVLNNEATDSTVMPGEQSGGDACKLVYARENGENLGIEPLDVPPNDLMPPGFDIFAAGENLLVHRLASFGADFGYLIFDIAPLESTLTEKICECIATAIKNCKQLELQKQSADQLRKLNQKLAHETNHDSITGLLNQRQCLSHVERAIHESNENGSRFSLMQIRLNDLDRIGLQYGREYSDVLLRTIAENLDAVSVRECCAFSNGTSEFTVIIQNTTDDETKEQISRLLEILEQPYAIAGYTARVSYCAGTATYPLHGFNGNELIVSANAALEYAAEHKGMKHVLFDSGLCRSGVDKWKLDKLMRRALEDDEFSVFYQPRIDIQTGKIEAFEALIRWFRQNEEGKKVPVSTPDVFIPVAEETGFIAELGDYVLNRSCEQLKEWVETGFNTSLSINLSAYELEAEDCVERIVKTLTKHNLKSDIVEIEVTESSAMSDIESSIVKLAELQKKGIQIAIDDFGTDYSSLNYLKRLPANFLKVDRSFLREIDSPDGGSSADAAIVRAVVTLGHSLGHAIVAEGVETIEQMEFLAFLGVEQAQGFYFSPAVDARAAEQMLRDDQGLQIKAA